MTTTEDKIESEIITYINSTRNRPSLADFIQENYQFVVESSPVNQSIKKFWTTNFNLVVQKFDIKHVNTRKKYLSWGELALAVLETAKSRPVLATTPTTNKKGNKRSSKNDSYPLSFKTSLKLDEIIKQMNAADKWQFEKDDGTTVCLEDIMLEHVNKCTFEHCSLSLIFDTDDKVWTDYFTEAEIISLASYGNSELPDVPQSVQTILLKCGNIVETTMEESEKMTKHQQQRKIIDNLHDYIESLRLFDPYTEYNECWVVETLRHFITLYRWDVLSRMNSDESSEIDIVLQIWSQLDKVFRNVYIDTRRDVSCVATSARINDERGIDGVTPTSSQRKSVRPDLVLSKEDLEYGLGEVRKHDVSGIGKKEIVETQLHSPKVLKDMFLRAIAKAANDERLVRQFKTICFNQTCFRMSLSVLDCPNGIICRMNTSEEYKVPNDILSFTSGIIPIIQLTLQAKIIVEESAQLLEKYKNKLGTSKPQFKYQLRKKTNAIHIPPCITVNSDKRIKTSGSSPTTSASASSSGPSP